MADSSGATLEVHFKLFGTDGVSLQSQELTRALRKRGWRVHSCASDVPDDAEGLRVPELSYQSDDAVTLRRRLFQAAADSADSSSAEDLLAEIAHRAGLIRARVEAYVDEHRIRVLHIRNIMSLPYNLAATLAFYELIVERTDIYFLLQHHDLYWEGPNARNFDSPYPQIADLIARITCPDRVNTAHTLINPIAAQALYARKGIQGVVVPDGFDFDREIIPIDEQVFRSRLETLSGDKSSITRDDLVVAMPARVAINKAIELAIQFVAGLEASRTELEDVPQGLGARQRRLTSTGKIVLLLPQGEDLEENLDYFHRLVAYAQHLGVTLAYGGNVVVPDRKFTPGDPDHFPFYSTYQTVDLVCYPPEHEGFGNQAIETVWARLPLAVLEYPVFKAYVRDHVRHYISLGDVAALGRLNDFGGLHQLSGEVLGRALQEAIGVLKNHETEALWVDQNAASLRAFCGIDTVSQHYIQLYERGLTTLPGSADARN
jgi:mannosylglucosylglycerate synthase